MQKCGLNGKGNKRDPDTFVTHQQDSIGRESIEYDNVELYFCGIQTSLATLSTSVVSVLACWALPNSYVTSVRTLALCGSVALLGTARPFKIQGAVGLNLIFNAMRPCPWIYLVGLVIEQLGHTCLSVAHGTDGFVPLFVFNALGISLAACGMWKSSCPVSSDDMFFIAILVLVVLMAVLPTPVFINDGPLCSPSSVQVAFEKGTRAILFAFLYSVFVYSTPPRKPTIGAICSCCLRATGGSVWVLVCSPWIFVLAPVQFVLAVWIRVHARAGAGCTVLKDECDGCCTIQSTSDSDPSDVEAGSGRAGTGEDPLSGHAAAKINCRLSSPSFKIPPRQSLTNSTSQRRACCLDEQSIAEALSAIPPGTFSKHGM
mgnify:CR=1 FL=1